LEIRKPVSAKEAIRSDYCEARISFSKYYVTHALWSGFNVMKSLQSISIVDDNILAINYKEEVATRVEPHSLTILNFKGFIRPQLIMQNMIEADLVNKRCCQIIP
jgi:hypothetical protein